MGKKLEHTPNSTVKSALRKLWMRSRERAGALKRDNYTCQGCNRKQSKAKGKEFSVQVHHEEGIDNWAEVIQAVRKYLLVDKDKLVTMCKECHMKEHRGLSEQ